MNILTFVAPGQSAAYTQHLAKTLEPGLKILPQQENTVVHAAGLGISSWDVLHQHLCSATPPYDCLIVAGSAMSFNEPISKSFDRAKQPARTVLAAWVGETGPRDLLALREAGFQHIVHIEEGPIALFRAVVLAHEERNRLIAEIFRDNARDIVQPPLPPAPQARDFGTQETAKRQGAEDRDDAFKLVSAEDAARYRDTPQQPLKPRAANPAYVSYQDARLNILEAHLNDALCLLVEAKGGHVDLLDRLTSKKGLPLKGATITTYVAALKASICRQTSLPRKEVNALIYNPPGTSPTTYALHNEGGAFAIHEICAPTATTAPTPQP